MPKPYSLPSYEDVFNLPYEQLSIDDSLESIRNKDILKYRIKLILAGNTLEVEAYPIWRESKYKAVRVKTGNETRKAQRDLNHKNVQKHVSRIIHHNFDHTGIWCTFTYPAGQAPADEKEAQRDIQNYFRNLRRHIKRHGPPCPELKYIYVTEYVTDETTGRKHAHHHIIMNFNDRDTVESLWKKGGRTQARRLQPDDFGLEGLARYISKDATNTANRKGKKTYATSKNIEKYKEVTSDHRLPCTNYRMSKKRVAELATNENTTRALLEEHYKNHKVMDGGIKIKFSRYVSGAYIHAKMMRKPTRAGTGRRRE